MVDSILELLVFVGIAGILYIAARALPRISDIDFAGDSKRTWIDWALDKLEHIDEWLLALFEKLLRRLRVVLLKLDNAVTRKLRSFRKNGGKDNPFPLGTTKSEVDEPPESLV